MAFSRSGSEAAYWVGREERRDEALAEIAAEQTSQSGKCRR
jgi:hypothetical protein